MERNPDLAVYGAEVRAQAARILQAGLRPNPEFSTEVENFLGSGQVGLIDSAETTFQVMKRFELGEKRKLRVRAAELERDVAAQALLVQQSGLLAIAAAAFIDTLAAQQRLANREQLLELAEKIHSTVTARVAAGKVSPIEASRSTVALESARLEKDKAAALRIAAKERLAALWQGASRDFGEAKAAFTIPPNADRFFVDSNLQENPELKQAQTTIEFRKTFLGSEIANRKPDITLSGGLRHLNQYGGMAWVATVSVPLPWFDKRQGLIAEASARLEKATLERQALENRLKANLALLRREGEAALQETAALAERILPAAQNAFDSLQEGYRQGKFDYLAVLDAQRTYFELKSRHIDAASTALKSLAQFRYLTGKILNLDFLEPNNPDRGLK
jgi:cobalt-zinc-cadmium efflux system outer membrane protein